MSHVTLIDAGHHEEYHREKKLDYFSKSLMKMTEIKTNKDPLLQDSLRGVKSIWFFGPKKDLNEEEVKSLHNFVNQGGSIVLLISFPKVSKNKEEEKPILPPNFFNFLKQYGVSSGEPVISPVYINYVNPKHVSIQNGILNRAINEFLSKENSTFAFPEGINLQITSPSVPLISSGSASYPLSQPVISYCSIGRSGGSVTVIGSPHMFCDDWFNKESNENLFNYLTSLIITKKSEINKIDADHPEVIDRVYTPDVTSMSERLRSCIQESEKMRSDFVQNFDQGLYKMDMTHLADSISIANTLGLKNEPLENVSPIFDTALPPLTPAVFPPQMREPSGPVLELFDLNDIFASPATRLAQLAQRTSPKNAEKFVIQAAKILGITQKLPEGKRSGKEILEYVFQQVVKWKRQSQD